MYKLTIPPHELQIGLRSLVISASVSFRLHNDFQDIDSADDPSQRTLEQVSLVSTKPKTRTDSSGVRPP